MIGRTYPIAREYDPVSGTLVYLFSSFHAGRSIPKIVLYTRRLEEEEEAAECFDLGFGDLIMDAQTNEFLGMDDLTESNNGDVRMVFHTVVSTIADFFGAYPDAVLHFSGSNPQRNNVYRALVARHWLEIEPEYIVWGVTNKKREPFNKEIPYESIVLRKKVGFEVHENSIQMIIRQSKKEREWLQGMAKVIMAKLIAGEIDPFREKRDFSYNLYKNSVLVDKIEWPEPS